MESAQLTLDIPESPKRKIVLKVIIEDEEAAKWIWESHSGGPINGLRAYFIADEEHVEVIDKPFHPGPNASEEALDEYEAEVEEWEKAVERYR